MKCRDRRQPSRADEIEHEIRRKKVVPQIRFLKYDQYNGTQCEPLPRHQEIAEPLARKILRKALSNPGK